MGMTGMTGMTGMIQSTHQSEDGDIIIPPQTCSHQPSRQQAQTNGDSGSNNADNGNDDERRLRPVKPCALGEDMTTTNRLDRYEAGEG